MRVAIVHDYIKEYGGAERVLEALCEIWPKASIYTTVYLPQFLGPHKKKFEQINIKTSILQKIPFKHKLISPFRLVAPFVFERFNFSKFDLVVVSATGAYCPNLIKTPNSMHICYYHTPPRYLYGYKTARNWKKNKIGRILAEFINHILRKTDYLSSQRPDYILCNSNEVKKRIRKFYKREAKVIHPPVSVKPKTKNQKPKTEINEQNNQYYLAGGRLARAKRIDLAIKACNKLKLALKIFGASFADYEKELKKIAGPTIEFLGEVSDEKLAKLYRWAKAFIYASEEEDFGIIPVEAQLYGAAVIGLNQGGVKETVLQGKTGILFDKPNVESLVEAIQHFEKLEASNQAIKRKNCIRNAKRFSKKRFQKEIVSFVNSKLNLDKSQIQN